MNKDTTYNPLPDTFADKVADAYWAMRDKLAEKGRTNALAVCAGLLLAALAI
ncbi:hypothetical protein ACSBOB_20045 [Mesorhizobium sp. ASY16-5R]|uniref:hypothetical protein n=1 Tax=Mesorhizobium sp. ASY16-5R TaxID=3445772 RepID=UPI003FA05877